MKKFYILSMIIVLIFGIFGYRVYSLAYVNHDYYLEQYEEISNIFIEGSSAPRGRILDINHKVIVDNAAIYVIEYQKGNNKREEEIEIAKLLVNLTDYKYEYNESKLKDYYMILYPDKVNDLITEEEMELVKKRKLTMSDLESLKLERIDEDMISSLSEEEKYGSYFYYLMNEGYIYDSKVLLKDIDEALYAKILEANIKGIIGKLEWVRVYPYQDSLRSILGSVSNSLPKDKLELLESGYSLTDRVGISGLEEYYEDVLKGEKGLYKVVDGTLVEVRKPVKGNDIVLEIDMDIQVKIEEIMKEQILKAKSKPNTKYYKESYALVSNPSTGALNAIVGIRLNDKGTFQDVSINVIKNAYAMGSVVKGASMSVGYKYGAIDIGTTMMDGCVKILNKPAKCSYTRLGKLNDIRALAQSSNYYQFIIALKVAGYEYKYNMDVNVQEEDFNKYRDMFASFGLGSLTNIDLKGETLGIRGEKVAPDLLLNIAIGQYDLYTPVGLMQYINTIANNGERLSLRINHSIIKDNQEILNEVKVLNKVDIEDKYLKRIQEGFREVIKHGTGYYYVNQKVEAAGKTGTSEVLIDSNYDGVLDTNVLNNTFIMYAPFDKPKYSIVVISPSTTQLDTKSSYNSQVNRYIARNINDFLFSI